MQVSEVEKSVDVAGLVFLEDVAFIIWDWEWIHEDFDSASDTEPAMSIESTPDNESEDDEDSDAVVPVNCSVNVMTHTLTFKCMGSTKEQRYQNILRQVSQILCTDAVVPCRITKEPGNPIDSRAIAFECNIDGKWQIIGYVVKEALEEVHQAIEAKKILEVAIDWVKFQLFWRAPGWYAGIKITREGKWSSVAMQSQSSKVHH